MIETRNKENPQRKAVGFGYELTRITAIGHLRYIALQPSGHIGVINIPGFLEAFFCFPIAFVAVEYFVAVTSILVYLTVVPKNVMDLMGQRFICRRAV
jgi:hypothetical protein